MEIRSISNYVERRNKENWDLKLSLKNLNQELLKALFRNSLDFMI
jgi:futalosine hydrolase